MSLINQSEALNAQTLDDNYDTRGDWAKKLAKGEDFKIDGVTVEAANLKTGHVFLLQNALADLKMQDDILPEFSKQQQATVRSTIQGFKG